MVRYFDSSFILSRLLGESAGAAANEPWRSASKCLASNLLFIECVIAIRRTARLQLQKRAGAEIWLQGRIHALDRILSDFDLKAVDRSIEEIIRDTPMLAECRTLDAIHLATALHFQPAVKGGLEIVTLDKRMGDLARKLGLATVSA